MDQIIVRLEKGWQKKDIPSFNIGDTVRVHSKIIEGEKERTQVFEGTVIGRKYGGHRAVITVRKISSGVGVERVFPLHSPFVQQIQVVREGQVRRAKLYYLRALRGKAARVAEKDFGRRASKNAKGAAAVPVVPDPVTPAASGEGVEPAPEEQQV